MPPGCGDAGVCGLEDTGGVMGPPWEALAGEAALGVGQGESSRGMGVGGLSSSDWERRRWIAVSSTYLLKKFWDKRHS